MEFRKQLLSLLSMIAVNLVTVPAPKVEIEQGMLSGIVSADGSILQYIGIPYATANSSNRFQAPLPPPKWKGVYKAIKEYTCTQYLGAIVVGTEDCLKLNVYVPSAAEGPLPVMVYIHGGSFVIGSGGKLLRGPDFLVNQDVILVTINYRLGVLGFLCLGIKEAPGNAGLKDQIAALRWVKKNIAAFGGDPDNVTLFGQSAGGTSTSLLLVSEAASGLFNKAIIQSGSSISARSVNIHPIRAASSLARKLRHNSMDPYKLYDIFSKLTPNTLVAATAGRIEDLYFKTEETFLPCIEKAIPGVEPAINDLPYNLFKKNPKNIPVMYGSNGREGLFLISKETDKTLEDKNNKYIFGSDLAFRNENEARHTDKVIKEYYFQGNRINRRNIMKLSELYTDFYYAVPAILETELLIKNGAPIYNYIFNYTGGRNFMKFITRYANEPGASHGDELLYLFTSLLWPYPVKDDDGRIIDWMTKMWTNFAKYGNPTPASSDLPVRWEPSSDFNLTFLYIDDMLNTGSMPNPEAYQLWSGIYKKYRKTYIDHY